MLRLLQEHLATILVGLAMLLLVGLALWGALASRRRAKRGGCSGCCGGCPSAGCCPAARTASGAPPAEREREAPRP